MTRTALALALLVAAGASRAEEPRSLAPPLPPPPVEGDAATTPRVAAPAPGAPAKPRVLPRGAVLEEVNGVLRAVDSRDNRLTVDTGNGPVTLGFDRNTMVYTGGGLGTVRDLKPGVQLRAGRNADMLAYWVQIRAAPRPATPPPTPGQGTGPGGASPPPSEGAGAGGMTSPPPGGSVGPGSVTPGTTPPAGGTPGAAGGTPAGAGAPAR